MLVVRYVAATGRALLAAGFASHDASLFGFCRAVACRECRRMLAGLANRALDRELMWCTFEAYSSCVVAVSNM